MDLFIALFMICGVIIQISNFIYWVLTKMGLTSQYKLAIETIVKDLGYTMEQYYTSDECRYFVTIEWCNRLRAD